MRVRDVMTTDIATVGPDATIAAAISVMTERRVSGVPVVEEADRLVGILTEGDLLRRVETGTGDRRAPLLLDLLVGPRRAAIDYIRTHSRRVSDLMTQSVITVGEGDPLSAAVQNVPGVVAIRDGTVLVEPLSGSILPP